MRLRALIAILIVAAVAGGGYWYSVRDSDTETAFQGYIEGNLVFMAPEEGGRIERLEVEAGEAVSDGQVLFALESSVQQAQRNEAEARYRQAEAQLANLKAALQRPEQVAVLRAQEERARASLDLSRSEYQRQQILFQRGYSAKARLDQAEAAFERDRAALEEVTRRSRRRSCPGAPARSRPPRRRRGLLRRCCARPRRASPSGASPPRRQPASRMSISEPARW